MTSDLAERKEANVSEAPDRLPEELDEGRPNLGAVRLLDEWAADDPSYDKETLPELKEALDRNRPGYRKLFD